MPEKNIIHGLTDGVKINVEQIRVRVRRHRGAHVPQLRRIFLEALCL
jgi:hypothetical protein